MFNGLLLGKKGVYNLPETNSSHLKMDGWKTNSFPSWDAIFQVQTGSFRGVLTANMESESDGALQKWDYWVAGGTPNLLWCLLVMFQGGAYSRVIKWDPKMRGMKQCKCMAMLRDFPYT